MELVIHSHRNALEVLREIHDPRAKNALELLRVQCDSCKEALLGLDQFIQSEIIKDLGDRGRLKMSRRAWFLNKERLQSLRAKIRDRRRDVVHALIAAQVFQS